MNKNRILLVDDDPGAIAVMGRTLAGLGELRFAANGHDALRLARECPPDLILLDAEMPGMSGFQTCKALKADPLLADIPVIFVSCHAEPRFEVTGFRIGAADFITKPIKPPLVVARVRSQLRMKRMSDELRLLSASDTLTGVANRRRFDDEFARESLRAHRSGGALTLLMIDVDHFKRYNDTYGHPAGDLCLRQVAQALREAAHRPEDLVARYGGEEFAVVLPATSRWGAEHLAQRLLDAVESLAIPHASSPVCDHVTISIGVATCDKVPRSWIDGAVDAASDPARPANRVAHRLLLAADRALYAAKNAGRAHARVIECGGVDQPFVPRAVCSSLQEAAA